jgi:uncharacterized protein (DUF362 family)
MDRRDFLRLATLTTGAVAAATLAPATYASVQVQSKSRVAVVKTQDRAEGVAKAIALLGVNPARGNRVLLKPNFNSADAAPGSTHNDVLRALVAELQDMGAKSITVGDRSGMGDTRRVMEQKGIFALSKELGFETVVFDALAEKDWATVTPSDGHWSRGFAVPKLLLDAECVVQTCNLKTHRFGGHFTLALKNSVGLVAKQLAPGGYNYMNELHGSRYQRHRIAEINQAYTPGLIVMDGVEAFTTGGPDRGKKVAANVVLAATDPVAIDAAGVAVLRLLGTTPEVSEGKVFEQAQLARAVELGLGASGPEQIELVTGDPAGAALARQIEALLSA